VGRRFRDLCRPEELLHPHATVADVSLPLEQLVISEL
jgi:hypothetical protein